MAIKIAKNSRKIGKIKRKRESTFGGGYNNIWFFPFAICFSDIDLSSSDPLPISAIGQRRYYAFQYAWRQSKQGAESKSWRAVPSHETLPCRTRCILLFFIFCPSSPQHLSLVAGLYEAGCGITWGMWLAWHGSCGGYHIGHVMTVCPRWPYIQVLACIRRLSVPVLH